MSTCTLGAFGDIARALTNSSLSTAIFSPIACIRSLPVDSAAETGLKQNISGHENRIRTLREREKNLQADLHAAQETVAAARTEVAEAHLRIYDRIASKPGHPVCVTVNGGRCGGCHLKVPTHLEVQAKAGVEITTCDQCGRILYWQS